MEYDRCCKFNTEPDTADKWQPPVNSCTKSTLKSTVPLTSNFKRSQSLRVPKTSKLKKKIEQRRKHVTLEEVEPSSKLNEDFRLNGSKDAIEDERFFTNLRCCRMEKEELPKKIESADLKECSEVKRNFSKNKERVMDEKIIYLAPKGTKLIDPNEELNSPDKDVDFSPGYIKSWNLQTSQLMRVSKQTQLTEEEIGQHKRCVTVKEDEPWSSRYEGFASYVTSIRTKISPREDKKNFSENKERVMDEKMFELAPKGTKLIGRNEEMNSIRTQLTEEIEQQQRYVTMKEDAPLSSPYKGFASYFNSNPSKTSPREDVKGFVKSRIGIKGKEWSDLCHDEKSKLDTVERTFTKKVEESQLEMEKPTSFTRSQSMRIPKQRKLTEVMDKQRKYATFEEVESSHEHLEKSIRKFENDMVVSKQKKYCGIKIKQEPHLIEIENKWTPQPKQNFQSLHQEERLENDLNLYSKRNNYFSVRRDKKDIKETNFENGLSNLDDRKRLTLFDRSTMKHSARDRGNVEALTVDDTNFNSFMTLHSKSPDKPYQFSKTTTLAGQRPSSVVSRNSSPFCHFTSKESDDVIRIWRFSQTSEFVTFQKEENVASAITKISKKLKIDAQALDLFYRHSMLNKTETLGDQVEVDKKGKVYVIMKQLSRQVPGSYLTDAPDLIDPWEDEIPRVLMSCGHGITCDNLYEYCRRQIEMGNVEFFCPAVPDQERPSEQCGSKWNFLEVREKACLSEDESNLFEIMLSSNKIQRSKDIYQCPGCSKYIESICYRRGFVICRTCEENYDFDFKFCAFCQRKWMGSDDSKTCGHVDCKQDLKRLQKVLVSCPTKEIVGIRSCPTVRACPNCNFIVEHEGDNCKHMDCPNKYCRTKFCFVCLQIKTDKYYWPESCGGAFIHCQLAPRQSV